MITVPALESIINLSMTKLLSGSDNIYSRTLMYLQEHSVSLIPLATYSPINNSYYTDPSVRIAYISNV